MCLWRRWEQRRNSTLDIHKFLRICNDFGIKALGGSEANLSEVFRQCSAGGFVNDEDNLSYSGDAHHDCISLRAFHEALYRVALLTYYAEKSTPAEKLDQVMYLMAASAGRHKLEVKLHGTPRGALLHGMVGLTLLPPKLSADEESGLADVEGLDEEGHAEVEEELSTQHLLSLLEEEEVELLQQVLAARVCRM